jgi:ATP-dependent Lon protease
MPQLGFVAMAHTGFRSRPSQIGVTLVARLCRRLRKMQPQQPGYGTSRTYLELLAELPWQIASEELEIDLAVAKERLDSEHYGLSKVKKRIIEYLAVRKVPNLCNSPLRMWCALDLQAVFWSCLGVQLKPDARGPVLCFVGPPGVGKTSLASSIAGALSRRFIRISLGGVKDEADIRGHRRTYIGSMPGRLIDGIKVSNLFHFLNSYHFFAGLG